MSHVSAISAGIFTDMSVTAPSTPPADFTVLDTNAEFEALFATEIQSVGGVKAANTYCRIKNVREFPSMGVAPNIVNVPVYGQKTSQQVQGQSDAPTIEVTLNYVPAHWAPGTILGDIYANSTVSVFRFAMMNKEPPGYNSTGSTLLISGDTSDGTVTENSSWYWVGKIEALMVNPQLTDANTATITISLQSKLYGPYTIAPTA